MNKATYKEAATPKPHLLSSFFSHYRPVQYTTPPNVQQPLNSMELAKAQSEAEAGDFWLVAPKGKEQWPVVICDEDMVMRFFKKNIKRPLNARQVDGSWPKDNGSGAFQAYDRCFPAMYLGTLKL